MTQIQNRLPAEPTKLRLKGDVMNAMVSGHYMSYVDNLLVAVSSAESLHCVRTASWTSKELDVWQIDAEILASYRSTWDDEVLYRVLDGVAMVVGSLDSVRVKIGAPSPAAAKEIEKWLRGRMPEHIPDEKFKGEVNAKVMWLGPDGTPSSFSRGVPASKLADLELNYAADTRNALAALAEFSPPPSNGRLILFHGEPGTGKSNAIKSIAAEWREWADMIIVSDVERLMRDPEYLLNMVRPADARGRKEKLNDGRYRLLVMEDAGEFLSPQAKAETGQALSRLLNITDGVMGDAGRALMLITTNEHISTLHPAVSRKGRCMAEIEFSRLNRAEIKAWCDNKDIDTP